MRPMNMIGYAGLSLLLSVTNIANANGELIIPTGALGVIEIDQVQEGNLLYLKGMKGEGRYVTRNQQGALCAIYPVSFLAGGFNGREVSVVRREPIRLTIYSQSADERIRLGNEVSSKETQIGLSEGQAEIVVDSGLSLEEHFILNPRPAWSSWWRINLVKKDCEVI